MYEYFFCIAQLKIRLKSPFKINLYPRLSPFLCEPCVTDIECELIEDMTRLEEIEKNGSTIYKDSCVSYIEYGTLTYRVYRFIDEVFFTEFDMSKPDWFKIHTYPREDSAFFNSLSEIMCFDIACLRRDGIQLHSSFIKTDSGAILFSAPSGTGKSTQAELWKQHKNAKIINGDKTILRKIDGKWYAFGSPWAGTSGIHINDFAPDPAIVILRQSPENRIKEISRRNAVMLLLSETKTQCWCAAEAERICSLLEDMTEALPVFMLECRPDIGAVEIVDNFLLNSR